VRLIALSPCHHDFQHGSFYRQDHHIVDVMGFLFTQVAKILLKAFANDVLDVVFTHVMSQYGEVLLGG
jgi:hypothetical protein